MERYVKRNIEYIPRKLIRNYDNTGTIIMFHGSGVSHEMWDDDVPRTIFRDNILPQWPEGKKLIDLMPKNKLNLQKLLSKYYTTFSYTPLEYLIENNSGLNNIDELKPNNYYFNMDQMIYTLKYFIKMYSLEPPYIFVGFSEGGWRCLLFQEHIKNVKKCVLIDPQQFVLNSPENILSKNNYDKLIKNKKKKHSFDNLLSFYKYKNLTRKYRLNKINCKLTIFMNIMKYENNFTQRMISTTDFVNEIKKKNPKTVFNFYFDELHMLHWLYRDEIIEEIIRF